MDAESLRTTRHAIYAIALVVISAIIGMTYNAAGWQEVQILKIAVNAGICDRCGHRVGGDAGKTIVRPCGD